MLLVETGTMVSCTCSLPTSKKEDASPFFDRGTLSFASLCCRNKRPCFTEKVLHTAPREIMTAVLQSPGPSSVVLDLVGRARTTASCDLPRRTENAFSSCTSTEAFPSFHRNRLKVRLSADHFAFKFCDARGLCPQDIGPRLRAPSRPPIPKEGLPLP